MKKTAETMSRILEALRAHFQGYNITIGFEFESRQTL
jgi:hypothetical protein